ncbi:N-acetyltransferase [Clostridia bacterium]|nr:N-acetyltransferase [Clostridia bacterium]
MNIKIVETNKKDYLDLLLLADEQENMIDLYLDRGTLFTLYDGGELRSVCVVTDEGGGNFEIQNLATYAQYQGRGYGRSLINHVCEYYKGMGSTMLVGTGDSPLTIPFYERSGFTLSHRIVNYIVDHYDKPIFEAGVQLKDKVYLKRSL